MVSTKAGGALIRRPFYWTSAPEMRRASRWDRARSARKSYSAPAATSKVLPMGPTRPRPISRRHSPRHAETIFNPTLGASDRLGGGLRVGSFRPTHGGLGGTECTMRCNDGRDLRRISTVATARRSMVLQFARQRAIDDPDC